MSAVATEALAWMRSRHEAMLEVLERLVMIDTPAHETDRIDEALGMVAGTAERGGARVESVDADGSRALLATWSGRAGAPTALILAHIDTVWPVGEAQRRPFTRAGGRITGPGVFNMKAGLVQGLHAAMAHRELVSDSGATVRLHVTSDEETGSRRSRATIEREARRCDAVLVVEPSSEGGALKTARKGIGMYELRVHGRAAHAGVEPEKGVSAVLEMAHQIRALHELSAPQKGITVTVGTVSGGTRRNVVPAEASAEIDLRVPTAGEAERLDALIRGLRPVLPGAELEVSGGINRPPMERSEGVVRLFELAKKVGREIGLDLTESSTGGGSDGNYTAALGVPTLDGLGAVGGGPHSLSEHVIEDAVPLRAALLAGLLQRVGE